MLCPLCNGDRITRLDGATVEVACEYGHPLRIGEATEYLCGDCLGSWLATPVHSG